MSFERIERVLSVVLSVATVVLIALVLRREFAPVEASAQRLTAPVFIPEWRSFLSHGMPDHNEQAAVQILEFADFECPACRLYQTVLSRVQERFGSAVSVVYFHFPIEYHRFARIAARAAECAKDEGKFWEMANSLYLNQDSLGLKQWSSLARESGIRDTVVFVACVDKTDPLLAVDSGIAIGKRIKLTGTPTIIVNGWRFPRPPSEEVLVQTVSDLLAGKNPQGKDR